MFLFGWIEQSCVGCEARVGYGISASGVSSSSSELLDVLVSCWHCEGY